MRLVGIVGGDAVSVGTAQGGLLYLCKLRHFGEPVQQLHQIGILPRELVAEASVAFLQQFAQVLHGRRNGIYEMLLALEIAAEAVGSQHLQRAEEHEQGQPLDEMAGRWHLGIVLQRVIVFHHQLAAQLMRIAGRGLPKERGQVVIVRTASAALEIDEIGCWVLGVGRDHHHVAGLEIAVKEVVAVFGRQVFGKHTEIGLELQFMEIQVGRLQETILEIVEVEQHAILPESRLRIAVLPVQSDGSPHLYVGQLADGHAQQFTLALVISASGLSPTPQFVEERNRAQVFLQIAELVVAGSKHLRHRQLAHLEMTGQVDEGMVFVAAVADDSHHGMAFVIEKTVILAVTAGSGQFLHLCRLVPAPFLVECNQIIHIAGKGSEYFEIKEARR